MDTPLSKPSSEFLLTAACCRWPPSERRNDAITEAIVPNIDWDRMLRIANRHRVAGLVHDGLTRTKTRIPPQVAQALADKAHSILRANLNSAAEAIRLHQLLRDAGVRAISFKGSSLALIAFDGLGIRHSKDIDILVAPAFVDKASKTLEAAGYRRFEPVPGLSQAGLKTYTQLRKDYAYKNSEKQIEIELHWRLFDNQLLMPLSASNANTQLVTIGDATIPTFSDDDLFAYLCLHGALTGWFRLKWLADIGALLVGAGPENILKLYQACLERGAGNAAGQAILLCHRLLATPIPQTLLCELQADATLKALERTALWAMVPGNEEAEPTDVFLGGMRVNISHLRLRPDWRYWSAEIKNYLIAPDDLALLPLPASLHCLYPFLRLPLWLWRHLLKRRDL